MSTVRFLVVPRKKAVKFYLTAFFFFPVTRLTIYYSATLSVIKRKWHTTSPGVFDPRRPFGLCLFIELRLGMQMVARLPDAVIAISQEFIPTDFLSPFSAAVTIIGGSYRTILTSASDATHIRTVRYAHPFRTVRVGQVTDHASRTAYPDTVGRIHEMRHL